jgi:hypothetical protein
LVVAGVILAATTGTIVIGVVVLVALLVLRFWFIKSRR